MPSPSGSSGDSFFGVRVPKGLTRPVIDFAGTFLGNMARNPVACVLCLMIAVMLVCAYHGAVWLDAKATWLADVAVPRHLQQIEAGYARQREEFIKATEHAHEDFQKERDREREWMRELRDSLKEIARRGDKLTTTNN